MGYKYNEKTGFWVVYYSKRHPITRVPHCARRSRCKTEADAKRTERELIIQVEQKLHENIVPKWEEIVRECYEVYKRDNTLKTAENYLTCIRHNTFAKWGTRLIDTITTDEIRVLIKEDLGERSKHHQRNVLHFIKTTFIHAVNKGILKYNPTPEMKFKFGDKIKKVLTEDQVGVLLNKAKEYNWEWYEIVAAALYTGMRSAELYALTWDKVNFDNRTILVNAGWNKLDGFKETKSGNDRLVAIAPQFLIMLKELKLKPYDDHFVLPKPQMWKQNLQAVALLFRPTYSVTVSEV